MSEIRYVFTIETTRTKNAPKIPIEQIEQALITALETQCNMTLADMTTEIK